MSLKIGDYQLKYGLMLAPMAGVTDSTFRELCISCGAEFTVSEMVCAKALCYEQRSKKLSTEGYNTAMLARVPQTQMPMSVQIFGSEPEFMAEAAAMIENCSYKGCTSDCAPAAIDINMGCPVRKITSNGEGSALMKDPRRIESIVRSVSDAVSIPVTAKLRVGWDEASRNAVECALRAEAGGAAAVCIHGRTRTQQYSGEADLAAIASVAEALSIPVIGNGDVRDGKSALRMIKETGCAALMIGRGAVGNPFVFREIASALEGIPYAEPNLAERLSVGLRQLSYAVADKGEETAVLETRKSFAAYLVGFRGAAALRARIHSAETYAHLASLAEEILSQSEG